MQYLKNFLKSLGSVKFSMKRDFLKIFLAKIILNFAGIVALFQKIYNSLQQKQSQKAFLEKTSQNLIALLSLTNIAFAEECVLDIAYDYEPPALYYNDKNEMMGLDKELLTLIAKKANCSIKWVNVPWARAQVMMKEGSLLMGSNAADSEERRQYANMVPYRPDTPNRLFVKKTTLEKIKANNLKEFLDKSDKGIGVVVGYQYDDEIANLMKDPAYASRFAKVTDTTANINKLVSDRTEGFIMEQLLGNYFIKQRSLENEIGRYDFSFGFNTNDQVNLMISKKADPQGVLTAKIIKALNELKDSSEYKAIINNYFN